MSQLMTDDDSQFIILRQESHEPRGNYQFLAIGPRVDHIVTRNLWHVSTSPLGLNASRLSIRGSQECQFERLRLFGSSRYFLVPLLHSRISDPDRGPVDRNDTIAF